MSPSRRTAPEPPRDPDLVGAEAAMRRAARRARERAARTGRRYGPEPSHDPRMLSFSQAQGYEEIPGPLKLEQLPPEARTRIWNCFYSHMQECVRGLYLSGIWEKIVREVHERLDGRPLDEWSADFRAVSSGLRQRIEADRFNRVFDLVQFVLRCPPCPPDFITMMKWTFAECGLAYAIDDGPPPTIVPTASHEEGQALVDAIGTLRDAGLDGCASHLREAAERINENDWAGAVRESLHAVESVARRLDPGASRGLGPALKSIEKQGGTLHPALVDAFGKLYGYASDEQGVRHALLDRTDSRVDRDLAVFMLGACASFASYLQRKHAAREGA